MIKYRLVVQLEPAQPSGWIAEIPDLRISKVRTEQDIFVCNMKAREAQPNLNLVKTIQHKVGGFLGMSKSESNSIFQLEKDVYQVGEAIRVSINCDNSSCRKAIRNFKVKIERTMEATSLMQDGSKDQENKANHVKYVAVFKDNEGCPAKTTVTKDILLRVPETDDYTPTEYS